MLVEPIVVVFGTALVAAMATDTWEQARSAVVALWRRVRAPQQSDTLAAELEDLREQVLAARRTGRGDVEQALAVAWQGRLQELLLNSPDLAAELRQVLDSTLAPMLAPAERARIGQVIMTGSSRDSSTFNQVAGNQTNIRL